MADSAYGFSVKGGKMWMSWTRISLKNETWTEPVNPMLCLSEHQHVHTPLVIAKITSLCGAATDSFAQKVGFFVIGLEIDSVPGHPKVSGFISGTHLLYSQRKEITILVQDGNMLNTRFGDGRYGI